MSISVPALCLLLAQSLPSQPPAASWPAELKLSLDGGGFQQGDAYDGWRVGGSGGATWFPGRPLVDDRTPLSIQAYLQRLDRLSFDIAVSGFDGKDGLTLYEHSGHSANLGLSGLAYLHDVVLAGGLYYARSYDLQHAAQSSGLFEDQKHTTQLAYPELTLGLRLSDVQMQGSYRFKTYFDDGNVRSQQWGQVLALVEGYLVNPDTFWRLSGYTLPDGEGASAYVEGFVETGLGLWLEAFAEHGQPFLNSRTDYDRKGIEFGVGWWKTHSLELQFSVDLTTSRAATAGATSLVTGIASFGIVMRAPTRQPEPVMTAPAPLPPRAPHLPEPPAPQPAPQETPPATTAPTEAQPSAPPPAPETSPSN